MLLRLLSDVADAEAFGKLVGTRVVGNVGASSRSRRLRREKEPRGSLTRAWGPEFSS